MIFVWKIVQGLYSMIFQKEIYISNFSRTVTLAVQWRSVNFSRAGWQWVRSKNKLWFCEAHIDHLEEKTSTAKTKRT